MSASKERRRPLGRGLDALLGAQPGAHSSAQSDIGPDVAPTAEDGAADSSGGPQTLPIEFIHRSKFQPRKNFDKDDMAELVESVRENGILQPILVRPDSGPGGAYQIVAGERRWRAAQEAQLHEIPVIIRELTDAQALEVALVENLQRQDLSPLEEAQGYQRLMDEYDHTQEALAKAVGKSRSHVANTLRLLNLPEPVRRILAAGDITAGHARALLNADDPEELARKIVSQGLNVRQTERIVQRQKEAGGEADPKSPATKDPDTIALETDLSGLLGLKVSINFRGAGGELVIHYNTLDQLDEVLRRIKFDQPSV